MNTYSKLSNREIDGILKEQEQIYNGSNYAIDCLKNKFYHNAQKSKMESEEFNVFKDKYDQDVKQMESDLDKRLNELKIFNTQRLADNKSMAKTHKEEMQELSEYYEDKLQTIRQEHRKSKNTFKELIVSRETELVRISKEIDICKKDKEHQLNNLRGQKVETKEQFQMDSKYTKTNNNDLEEIQNLNKELQKENQLKIRRLRRLNLQFSQIKQVNDAMKMGIDKLTGVAYGKSRSKQSRNKSKTLSKAKSKACIKPTREFVMKLSKKNILKPKKIKNKTSLMSSVNNVLSRNKCKSVLKSSRPIFTRLQQRRQDTEDAYQMSKTRKNNDSSMNSDISDSNESLYSIERKKLNKKSKISLIKTRNMDVSSSMDMSNDWVKCPTIEEDYTSSYGPKRKTKIDLMGYKKLTRFESQPVFNL